MTALAATRAALTGGAGDGRAATGAALTGVTADGGAATGVALAGGAGDGRAAARTALTGVTADGRAATGVALAGGAGDGRAATGAALTRGVTDGRAAAGAALTRGVTDGRAAARAALTDGVVDGRAPLAADLLYGRLLATAAQGPPVRARIRLADGRLEPLPLDRWLAPADAVDRAVLAGVEAPVLDLGCGPGRHLAALRALGKRALGVDLSPVAVALARDRGADAIIGSLWADVPGRWRTILLLDGNIGIGGNPVALLWRAGELLAPGGAIVVETDPPGAPTRRVRIRIEAAECVSDWFRWARVGVDGVGEVARRAGFDVVSTASIGNRTFVTLR